LRNKILITKDALRIDYLSCYGGKYWKTSNIDELANKGTIFLRHYTSAPSTAMAITSMFSGIYAHELDRQQYSEVDQYTGETLFDIIGRQGVQPYVIWPFEWDKAAWKYSKVFPENVEIVSMKEISEGVGRDSNDNKKVDEELSKETLERIIFQINKILSKDENIFVWLHLPHVIKGRLSYGSDIDLFDKLVGNIRELFDDDSIYLSSDHGHMNYEKNIPVYGFHVYEGAIRVPFITPRIDNKQVIDFPTSHTQLKDIISSHKIEREKFVYSDTQYYVQDNRRISIIKNQYKYIFSKKNQTEELFDLHFDPDENVNLLVDKVYDINRLGYYNLNETYYYPHFNKLKDIYLDFKSEKERIWKTGSWLTESIYQLNNFRKLGLKNFTKSRNSKKIDKGHFGSRTQGSRYNP